MKGKNSVAEKSVGFAIRVVEVYKYLCDEKEEYTRPKQLLRSGRAIGALTKEGEHTESKADFVHKLSIALKEANETNYWLLILKEPNFIDPQMHASLHNDCDELTVCL